MYYLKRFGRFLALVLPTFWFSLTYHRRSRYSRGLLRDIIDFQVMNWLDLRLAWSLHWRSRRYAKLHAKRYAAWQRRLSEQQK